MGIESWWCAADHHEWSKVESAMKSDSCFCLYYSTQQVDLTADEADSACRDRNGTLADFRNDQEVAMIEHLITSFNGNDADLKNACPFDSTYANHSCFMFLGQLSASIEEADQNCRNNYPGSGLLSLHSTYEHNAAFREYSVRSTKSFVDVLGVYTGLHRDRPTDWKWTDGSPLDYWPTWSVWRIPCQPQTDPNAFFIIYPLLTSLSSYFDEEIASKRTFWSNTNSTDVPRNLTLDENRTPKAVSYFLSDSNQNKTAIKNFADDYSESLTNSDARRGTKSEQHLQSWPYSDCLINPPENYSID
uniref:C-type lectin domain-containing protein n=1 Tax=Romanomermis culicivorax TaxID=13658 RepID=A0A915K186_ROMCU